MDIAQLTAVCNRLAKRLDGGTLDSLQLIDIATVVMCIRSRVEQELLKHPCANSEPTILHTLDASLRWIKVHADIASPQELQSPIGAALRAARASLFLLASDAHWRPSNDIQTPAQDSAYPRDVYGSNPA